MNLSTLTEESGSYPKEEIPPGASPGGFTTAACSEEPAGESCQQKQLINWFLRDRGRYFFRGKAATSHRRAASSTSSTIRAEQQRVSRERKTQPGDRRITNVNTEDRRREGRQVMTVEPEPYDGSRQQSCMMAAGRGVVCWQRSYMIWRRRWRMSVGSGRQQVQELQQQWLHRERRMR